MLRGTVDSTRGPLLNILDKIETFVGRALVVTAAVIVGAYVATGYTLERATTVTREQTVIEVNQRLKDNKYKIYFVTDDYGNVILRVPYSKKAVVGK